MKGRVRKLSMAKRMKVQYPIALNKNGVICTHTKYLEYPY
jgi:hypothetical protein